MRIISLIEKKDQADIIEKMLKLCGLWTEPEERASPRGFAVFQESQHTFIPDYPTRIMKSKFLSSS
jgi:hypothetical protein